MKIEVGKVYKTRAGYTVVIAGMGWNRSLDRVTYCGVLVEQKWASTWNEDGAFLVCAESDLDIVREEAL